MMIRSTFSFLRILFASITFLLLSSVYALSANVSLGWDPNDPAPEGYRVFVRQEGHSYDYAKPTWESHETLCTLTGLTEGVTYYFVVRAFDGDLESADSSEVSYTPKSSQTDSDQDSVPDALDKFPNDPSEWADNDNDGIGNNGDFDDDNDGMDDDWEIENGLDPYRDDAHLDADGDGNTNYEEFKANTMPATNPDNSLPDAPIIDEVQPTESVTLTPVLVASNYADRDDDAHDQTRWQISTEDDFSELVLDITSKNQLNTFAVGEMVLDVDTQYFWRAAFIDSRNGVSEWSDTASFTTFTAEESDDMNANGVPDKQEVDSSVDVNQDGTPDLLEDDLMSVYAADGQTIVGVEVVSGNATLVSAKSLGTQDLTDQSIPMAFGLIGFKLYLDEGESTATVRIHFSTAVDALSKVYKYHVDTGWKSYADAIFATDGKSVTIVLEDGGVGDEDGVKNGIIVDPSGISDPGSASTSTVSAGSSSGGGGCFISSGIQAFDAPVSKRFGKFVYLTLLVFVSVGVMGSRFLAWNNLKR